MAVRESLEQGLPCDQEPLLPAAIAPRSGSSSKQILLLVVMAAVVATAALRQLSVGGPHSSRLRVNEAALLALQATPFGSASSVKKLCSPPVESFHLPQKGCPDPGDVYTCVAKNAVFTTFAEAWAACGRTSECGFVMQWTTGDYYLRRASDPDQPILGAGSMRYSCSGRGQVVAPANAPAVAAIHRAAEVAVLPSRATAHANTPTDHPKEACTPPAENFDHPQKGCPKADVSSCVAMNKEFATFATAWAACGAEPECGFVMRWTTGSFYLRRHSDPDQPVLGASSMRFSCAGRPAVQGGVGAIASAVVPAVARTLRLEATNQVPKKACSAPAQKNFNLPQKGCPAETGNEKCVAGNADYATFEEAWTACGKTPECGVIMRWARGSYYLRRRNDPDQPGAGGGSMLFSC